FLAVIRRGAAVPALNQGGQGRGRGLVVLGGERRRLVGLAALGVGHAVHLAEDRRDPLLALPAANVQPLHLYLAGVHRRRRKGGEGGRGDGRDKQLAHGSSP